MVDTGIQIRILEQAEPAEEVLLRDGYSVICGVDEAGRGPLAGPVVAAAVIYKESASVKAARDSKQISPRQREQIHDQIVEELDVGIGICSPEEIEALNIRGASLEAMRRAVIDLKVIPDILLVDGRDKVPMEIISLPIVKGDAKISIIGAASIIAKVTRDKIMTDYDMVYPEYGFAKHSGYPTKFHREAIKKLGPCPIHRRSFRGVREYV